jgi:peptide chain release factor 1
MRPNNSDEKLIARLETLRRRYVELTDQMRDPEIAVNPQRIAQVGKEWGRLGKIVNPFLEYCKARQAADEAKEILEGNGHDADLKELARDELPDLEQQCDRIIEQIKEQLVSGTEDQIESIILEIRAGTGGDEAALFARVLYDMYLRFAERHRLKVDTMDISATDLGGIRELILNIKGHGVYRWFGYEAGGHRVQRVPQTEAQGRVHTSAATVAVLPEAEEIDVAIDWSKDVLEHVSRAGGPGGQNVNKVSSAIRLEHIPTGITVSMQDEKSQHKNRDKARRIMRARVYDHFESKRRAERDAARSAMIGSGDRSQRIRTYNFPQNRITDHRINLSLYSLDRAVAGHLDDVVTALQTHDKQQRLENLDEEL